MQTTVNPGTGLSGKQDEITQTAAPFGAANSSTTTSASATMSSQWASQTPIGKLTALYARTSTLDQKNGLQAQIRTLIEFCEKNNIKNFEVFADDGISGTKASRPALDKMMTMARAGQLEQIIVYSFSRYARSVTHLLQALEELRSLNVAFNSYTEKLDTNSPLGKAFFVVIAAISALERDLIVERVKNGLKNAKLKGKIIGRKKTRPSELIRAMLKGGATLRETARFCKTSHGSVSLERKLMRQEEAAREKIERENAATIAAGGTLVLDDATPWA